VQGQSHCSGTPVWEKGWEMGGWCRLSIDVQLLAIQKVVRLDSAEKIRRPAVFLALKDSHAVLLPKDPRDLRDLFIEAEHFGLPELRKRPESLKKSWLRLVLF